MKKITFISIGIIGLILLGVWAYLLFWYTPDKTKTEGGLFANFGWFTNQAITPIEIPPPVINNEIPLLNVNGPRLSQLTTKPVAGYTEILGTSTEPYFIRYVEAGLGHIYDINMQTGEETRSSNTTVPQTIKAEFSPNGTAVAIQADVTARNIVTTGIINDGEFVGQSLPSAITDFAFANNEELYYAKVSDQGIDTQGKALHLATGVTRNLFTIPFRLATIGWAKDNLTNHYIYTKPTSRLLGYLYTIENEKIVRAPMTGDGLNVIANDQYIVYSVREGENHITYTYNRNTKEYSTIPILALPEKCTFSKNEMAILYCGFEYTFYDYKFPDTWYKGIISFNDSLWRIDLNESSASQLVIPLQAVGRELDIINPQHSANTNMLYFINKYDKTLWVYKLVAD